MLKTGERPLRPEEQEFLCGLYQNHYKALFDCAYQLGIGREAAEDYVHDAFATAIRHIEDIKKSTNPRRYLKQALKNTIGYKLRSLRYAINLQRHGAEADVHHHHGAVEYLVGVPGQQAQVVVIHEIIQKSMKIDTIASKVSSISI